MPCALALGGLIHRRWRRVRRRLTPSMARYGDFVRYRPPLKAVTRLLWFGPALLVGACLIALALYLRRRSRRADVLPLSDEERAQAEALLRPDPDDKQ